jgi:hypothetical protein
VYFSKVSKAGISTPEKVCKKKMPSGGLRPVFNNLIFKN